MMHLKCWQNWRRCHASVGDMGDVFMDGRCRWCVWVLACFASFYGWSG